MCFILVVYSFRSIGWRWLSDKGWQVDMSPDNIDDEGWSYAVNFGEFRDLESGQFDIKYIDI